MINDRMFYNYIGPEKALWYHEAFEKYENNPGSFAWNWSWWALFGGPFFLLYRKCYLEAFIYFLIWTFFCSFGLVISVISGFLSPYLIYKRYERTVKKINKLSCIEEEQLRMAKEEGGVNRWAIWILVILIITLFIFAGAFIGTLIHYAQHLLMQLEINN